MKTFLLNLTTAALLASTQHVTSSLHAASVIQFEAETYHIDETLPGPHSSSTFLSILIDFGTPFARGVKISVNIVGGTAKIYEDFQMNDLGSVLEIPNFALILDPIDDGIPEPDETVELELKIIEGDAVLGPRSKTTVTIHNSKPQVKLVARPGDESPVIGVFEVSDGPVGDGPARPAFDLIRTGDRDQPATVNVEFFALSPFPESPTGGVAAVPGRDFTPVTNRIDFAPGQGKVSLQIPIIENTRVDERERYFGFRMTSPTPGLELVPSKTVTIIIEADIVPANLDVNRDPYIFWVGRADRVFPWWWFEAACLGWIW